MTTENKLDVRVAGLAAKNPFTPSNSSSRGMLDLSQTKGSVVINNPELPIIMSGLEQELLKGNMGVKIPANSKIIHIAEYRYKGELIETYVIYYNEDKDVIDREVIKQYNKNNKWFGYKESPTDDFADLKVGDVITEETKLTTTPSDVNGEEAIGIPLNIAWIPDPATDEDAMVFSDAAMKKFKFQLYHTFTLEYTSKQIPTNMYGDEDTYRAFADIGETVRRDGILFTLRRLEDEGIISKFSKEALLEPDETFDKVYRVKHETNHEEEVRLDMVKVVDVRPYYIGDKRLGALNKGLKGTYEQIEGYHDAYKKYMQSIIDMVESIEVDYVDANFGNQLHVDYVNFNTVLDNRVKKSWNRDPLGIWRVDITVEYTIVPGNTNKFTTRHGHKGISSSTRPEKEMPIDSNGLRAEGIINPIGINNRMNMGNPLEGYIAGNTVTVSEKVIDMYSNNVPQEEIDEYVTGYLDLINPDMSPYYRSSSKEDKEAYGKNIRVLLTLMNVYTPYDISVKIMKSKYAMDIHNFYITVDGKEKVLKSPIGMQNNYMLLLYKLGDDWLSCNLSYINKLGIPVAASKEIKTRLPFNNTPTKLSISEGRMYPGFLGREVMAEMRDRSINPDSQRAITKRILEEDDPMAIDRIIDRDKIPFGGDVVLHAVRSLTQTFGEDFEYVKETD